MRKRQPATANSDPAKGMTNKLAKAASKLETRKTLEGLNLSATENIANNKVPEMKPNWTMEVIQPMDNWFPFAIRSGSG